MRLLNVLQEVPGHVGDVGHAVSYQGGTSTKGVRHRVPFMVGWHFTQEDPLIKLVPSNAFYTYILSIVVLTINFTPLY